MNKTAIKNFAMQARNKLIAEITYKAGLMGITETGIQDALPQSGNGTEVYDIGRQEPHTISGVEIRQRKDLVAAITAKQADLDYRSAYEQVMDEVAYTWFNRLIAVRFMEVNDYLPSRIRVLSSESGKLEPDIVTDPFDALMEYTDTEKEKIIGWKKEEKLDELFRFLFLKQCNELSEVLPALFEKVSDYTELLLAISFIDKEGVVYHLVHDIPEHDFRVETDGLAETDSQEKAGGQVEIIGWLYQYYNTEPKAKVFARASGTKIKKEEIPAATQLFTPDWIVRYMVENSLGRLWLEGHPDTKTQLLPTEEEQEAYVGGARSLDDGKWHYYLEEAEQEPEVKEQLLKIRKGYAVLNPEDLLCIDPCMGSGHILCYFFDVLMQIYESQGYGRRDAVQSILEHNIWGLDIDERAYQLAYFAVMMKARQYDRRILGRGIQPHVYAIMESNGFHKMQLKYFGAGMEEAARDQAQEQVGRLLEQLYDAKEYGSILTMDPMDWELLREYAGNTSVVGQMEIDAIGIDRTQEWLQRLIDVGEALAQKYHVTCTNPPYMGGSGMDKKLSGYVKKNYPDSKGDLFAVFIERCGKMTAENCNQAMITQHAWMFLSSFEKLRKKLLIKDIVNMAHLGARAFEEIGGEVVQTASFVLRKSHVAGYKGTYCRLIDPTTQQGKEDMFLAEENRFTAQQDNFSKIPGSLVAYWVSDNFRNIFRYEISIGDIAFPKQGIHTGDNNKYLRLWHEVDNTKFNLRETEIWDSEDTWAKLNKGGNYRKWYGNREYVILWKNNGSEIKNNGHSVGANNKTFFRDMIGFTDITSYKPSFRYYGKGVVYDVSGPSMFNDGTVISIPFMMGLLNCVVVDEVMKLLSPTIHMNQTALSKMTIILVENELKEKIEYISNSCITISRTDWNAFENSWDFQRHPLCKSVFMIEEAYTAWVKECENRFKQLKTNEEELNRIFIDIYGLQGELAPEVEDKDVTVRNADLQRDIKSLISYVIGCIFGRYSLDVPGLAYAGGEWDSSKYSTFLPVKDNVVLITDEEYLDNDIVGLFCSWLKKVYGEDTLEENLDFIARALGNKGNSSREIIRNYFLNGFFKDHCSTYSVTGSGKRPIYWLYDSGRQNGLKALVYLHRYNADTTGRVRADYLHRMEKIYSSEIERMEETMQNSKNNREVSTATKRREKLQKQLKECQEYDEKIAHLALARIEIDLDDGVKVNYRKVQTDRSGRFYEILADSKTIMIKDK